MLTILSQKNGKHLRPLGLARVPTLELKLLGSSGTFLSKLGIGVQKKSSPSCVVETSGSPLT